MFDIVGIGSCVYDTLLVVNSFPGEDTKIRAEKIFGSGGGPCATGLVAASKLGGKCSYLGNLADDEGGRFLLEDFKRYNVDTQNIKVFKERKSFVSYVIINKRNSTRTCVAHKGDLPEFFLTDEHEKIIRSSKMLLIDGNELNAAKRAVRSAKRNNVKIIYDAGSLYEGIEELLYNSDILIPSQYFAQKRTGESDICKAAKVLFEKYSPEVVVVTEGEKGGVIYEGTGYTRYDAFKIKAVDTNGAGDVFHGAYAFAINKGLNYYESSVFASAASALKCTREGSRQAAPTYDEVKEFLDQKGLKIL